jgi:hypothetical protein
MEISFEQMKEKVYSYLMKEYDMEIEDISLLLSDDIDIKLFYLELYLKNKID